MDSDDPIGTGLFELNMMSQLIVACEPEGVTSQIQVLEIICAYAVGRLVTYRAHYP